MWVSCKIVRSISFKNARTHEVLADLIYTTLQVSASSSLQMPNSILFCTEHIFGCWNEFWAGLRLKCWNPSIQIDRRPAMAIKNKLKIWTQSNSHWPLRNKNGKFPYYYYYQEQYPIHPQGTWQVSIVVPRGNVIDNMDEKRFQVNVKF